MSDPGPRKPEHVAQQTGFGTPRSADDGRQEPGAFAGDAPDVTDEQLTGMESTAHPAQSDRLDINRSGSGGSGGPVTQDDETDLAGSTPASMHELLTGEEDDSSTTGG